MVRPEVTLDKLPLGILIHTAQATSLSSCSLTSAKTSPSRLARAGPRQEGRSHRLQPVTGSPSGTLSSPSSSADACPLPFHTFLPRSYSSTGNMQAVLGCEQTSEKKCMPFADMFPD